ncbi:MAG: tetratricopeptide repeat protein [Drouetiella hepatica Uher 2000/2452]|jgi:tetratricopeptide (TPR) repeat protein|uniref:Tetratricopeptide repeat protein n=1 Tax=Drouetiella hepatica Uher 2000/2452 TaxID=904376 RepID=A0A951UP32_9CYAN|nr:tetratricopeptide repeat protein [Drouetiella hepatica Uher 2000/2452]
MVTTHLSNAIAICEQALASGTGIPEICQKLGNVLQGMGNFQEAVTWHTRALQQQPNLARAYADLGKLHASQQQWQEAIALYEKALQLDSDNDSGHDSASADLHRHLASLYGRLGQRTEEVLHRYQAVTLNPRWANPKNQLVLGNTLLAQGKLEEAIVCYRRGIQLRPDFYEAYYNLGVALSQQEQWQASQAAFLRAVEINSDHADSWYGLGKLAEYLGNWTEALDHYQRSTELDDRAEFHHALGNALLTLRQWQRAEIACRRAIELSPGFSWAHHNLGYVLLKQRRWQEASVALQQGIALNPESPWTYYHLGTALRHHQEAIAAFLSAIQLQPDLADVYRQLGCVLRHQAETGGLESTLRYCQSLLQGKDPQFCAQVASNLAEAQQFDGAIVFWDLAVQLSAQVTQQQRMHSVVGKQQIDAAIANHRQEIQRQPEASWLYTHLGNLLADQGEVEEAIALHRKAIQLNGWEGTARQYEFTHDWFSYNISIWATHLKPFTGHPVQSLEIGSFEGMSACWLLDHVLTHPMSNLTCIDQYFQEIFEFNVAQTGAGDRLTRLTGDSHTILATLAPETYDIVYIDGCHLANHVHMDAQLAWKLVKAGGVMIFDDYEWTDPNYPGQDTRLGIDAFISSVKDQVAIVHQGYQIIIQKLRSDRLFNLFESLPEDNRVAEQMSLF